MVLHMAVTFFSDGKHLQKKLDYARDKSTTDEVIHGNNVHFT